MTNIAILASGSGSNAKEICAYFAGHNQVNVSIILSNNKNAKVLSRNDILNTERLYLSNKDMQSATLLDVLKDKDIHYVVLAGYLRKIPIEIIRSYPNKIINIHPALLPNYGGRGMYGQHVHQAVLEAKEKESGITIHFVNEHYDEGKIIFQASCSVQDCHTAEEIGSKVLKLEHAYYSKIIHQVICQDLLSSGLLEMP